MIPNIDFLANIGWLQNFMKGNGLPLQRKTSVVQKDPD